MLLKVNPHKIEIVKSPVNEREINISKCTFEFADEITNDYVKEAYFTFGGTTYKQIIVNDECDFPSEVLTKKGTVEIGVVAYLVENENEIKRYNPSPAYFDTWVGSLKDKAKNSEPITPSEMEQYEQALNDGLNEVNDKLDEIDQAIDDVNEAIIETNNLDLDVDKQGKVATVTLTKKDASTKTVTLSDGTSLQFKWEGTKLGIKTDDEQSYTYVDLEGPQGKQGIQGPQGPQGIPGPQGETGATGNGILSIQKTATAGLVDTYTITFTDGTTTTFDVTNGEDGEVTQKQLDETNENVSWLQTLTEQMPHVSEQGTDLSLQSVLNYRLMKFLPQGVSSQDGEPTPTTPVPVKSVTGENSLVIQNENLLPLNDIAETTRNGVTYSCSNGALKLNGTATGGVMIEFNNVVIPAGTYMFSSSIDNPNGSGSYARYITSQSGTNLKTNRGEITFTEDTSLHFRFYANSGAVFNNATVIAQLVKGSTEPTTYVEHEEQNYRLSFGNMEFNSSPDGTIRDAIIGTPDNWVKREYISKVVLNGSENWGKSANRFVSGVVSSLIKPTTSNSEIAQIFSNKFIGISINQTTQSSPVNGIAIAGSGNLVVYYDALKDYTYQEFATWLSSNNVLIYYVLATPTDIPITDTTLINQLNDIYNNAHSYNGVTNITTTYESGNEQMYLDVEVLKNVWDTSL